MKHKLLSLSLVAAFFSTMIFTGCSKDDETAPEVAATVATITGVTGSTSAESATFTAGTAFTLTYSVTTGVEISKIVINETIGTTTTPKETKTSGFTSKTAHSGTFAYTVPAAGPITLKVEATDSKGVVTFDTFVVTVGSAPYTGERTVQLLNNLIGLSKGAYDLVVGVQKASGDLDADKDMKNTSSVSVTAFSKGWTAGNATMFVKAAAGFNYTAASATSAATEYTAGTASATVSNVVIGDIYIAKLRGGANYAVIKITNVTGDTPSSDTVNYPSGDKNDGSIEFSYKY